MLWLFLILIASVQALNITVQWDSSVDSAPQQFKPSVLDAVQFFQFYFIDPVAINIQVGFGVINGAPMADGSLGQSDYSGVNLSYQELLDVLQNQQYQTTADKQAIATLPNTDPTHGGLFSVTRAQAKALGLIDSDNQLDGWVGFSSAVVFDYNRTDDITEGAYDLAGTVLHEVSEVLGRVTHNGVDNRYSVLDLYHFKANGSRLLDGVTPGYFSIDGGATNLNNFNTDPSGDFGDWASGVIDAAAASIGPGVLMPFTNPDMLAMDVVGWALSNSSQYNVTVKIKQTASEKAAEFDLGSLLLLVVLVWLLAALCFRIAEVNEDRARLLYK